MGRLAILIDGGYLDKVLEQEFKGLRIDYALFARAIANHVSTEANLLRVYYYNCMPYQSNPPTPDESARYSKQRKFFAMLNRLPRFEIRYGAMAKRVDARGKIEFEQKRVDVLVAVDLVRLAVKGHVTDIVIVSGDSDFVPAIEVAKGEGVLVWLLHGANPHDDLWTLTDERIRLTPDFLQRVTF